MAIFDRFLYYYTTLFVIIITIGAFFSGFALQNLLGTVIFLPVTFTLLYQLVQQFHRLKIERIRQTTQPTRQSRSSRSQSSWGKNLSFEFSAFFAQRSPLFLATLALFVVTITVSILRAGLSYLPPKELISPIPESQLSSH